MLTAADVGAQGQELPSPEQLGCVNKEDFNEHKDDQQNPHGVTAEQVGARPDTWTPSAAEVGARPDTWTPSAEDVGARPNTWTPSAEDVGARPNTWMPTAAQIGAAPAYSYGMEELEAGVSELETGKLYFVYE